MHYPNADAAPALHVWDQKHIFINIFLTSAYRLDWIRDEPRPLYDIFNMYNVIDWQIRFSEWGKTSRALFLTPPDLIFKNSRIFSFGLRPGPFDHSNRHFHAYVNDLLQFNELFSSWLRFLWMSDDLLVAVVHTFQYSCIPVFLYSCIPGAVYESRVWAKCKWRRDPQTFNFNIL